MKNKNKRNIIIIVSISLLILLLLLALILGFNKRNNKEKDNYEDIIIKSAEAYFTDNYDQEETSINVLLVNKYIKEAYGYDTCTIIQNKDGNINLTKEVDCEKSNLFSVNPVIIINGKDTNGFKIDFNDWQQNNVNLSFDIKSGGSNNLKQEDIVKYTWLDLDGNVLGENKDILINNLEGVIDIRLNIQFKTFDFNKIFQLKVDNTAPLLVSSSMDNNFPIAYYVDNLAFNSVLYFASEKEVKEFDKTKFCIIQDEYESGKTYFIYSYANDFAGNESEISYLGKITIAPNNVVNGGSGTKKDK